MYKCSIICFMGLLYSLIKYCNDSMVHPIQVDYILLFSVFVPSAVILCTCALDIQVFAEGLYLSVL